LQPAVSDFWPEVLPGFQSTRWFNRFVLVQPRSRRSEEAGE
jgi:hypothetical protein